MRSASDDPATGGNEPSGPASVGLAFDADAPTLPLPDELPVLPLRGVVVFPAAIAPLLISRQSSVKLVEDCAAGDRLLALVAQKHPDVEHPAPEELHTRGTAGRVLKTLRYPDGSIRLLVQGLQRIDVTGYTQREPYLRAAVRAVSEVSEPGPELDALVAAVVAQFGKLVSLTPYLPDELQVVAANIADPAKVTDLIASNLNITPDEKQALLARDNVRERLEELSTLLTREIELLELSQKIQSDVQSELTKSQKEFFLRQQLKAIQRELGEGDARTAEVEELRRRLEEAKLPPEAQRAAERELERLALIPPESMEHSVVRTYLEWLATLPWNVSTEDNLDLAHARAILDEDHYDVERVKERILEYLAVRTLRRDPKGPILCFVGPPGVGKTSLGRSIARAMGRKFVRLSLGGIRDEAEIRGHRRTYVGALPGRIIQNLRNAGANNPLFMLDEIDKLGMDFRGDPAAALLEVLDPEQNATFQDHYLDVPFDLHRVMFVTTANVLDAMPPALRDRMEVIDVPGYDEEQKLEIARRHLVPKQREEAGLTDEQISFDDDALRAIIQGYTREAGLRNLEREIGRVCRKVARRRAEGDTTPVRCTAALVREMLGPERFFPEVVERSSEPGVAVGLAWTPAGGDILFIEASRMAGTKQLTLTGQLRDVMKESAQTALSWVRAHAAELGIDPDFFERSDIHIHVPQGAIPKDGPSAGITMAVALASLLTGRPVQPRLAMTGEITLRGRVLPVGGVKEKILAARRAGIDTVILPAHNRSDLDEVPAHVREQLRFVFVETMREVLAHALPPSGGAHAGASEPALH
ncbi:MAG TPA: endopeptidase La [Candidatus Limnocylindria bacterium]|nr:endopeptidase La [Candidatus Limnocylindria bacterium]